MMFGKNIHGYQLGIQLGSGGFGTAHMAMKGYKWYAIKQINVGSGVDKNTKEAIIMKEVEIFSSLSHQNVVKYCEHFEENNAVWIVMEYCEWGTLNSLLLLLPLDPFQLLNFILQMSMGLEYLRSQNVIHRDIKPDNIMLRIGSQGLTTLNIADFGVSRVFENINQQSPGVNTAWPPYYSAPEVMVNGPNLDTADIFSLGCVILAMFSRTTVPWIGGKRLVAPYIPISNNNTINQLQIAQATDAQKWNYIQKVVKLPYGGNEQLLQRLAFYMVQHDWSKRPNAKECTEWIRTVMKYQH